MFNVNQNYCNFIVKYLELEEKNISPTSLTKYNFEEERNNGVCNVQTMVPVPFLLNKMHSS